MLQLQHRSSVAACSGYTRSRDSLLCACARTLVHVPGTYHIIHNLQRTATAVVVLQLLALSAAACLAIYTAV